MECPIYILAQGKSSRMGMDKGLVKIGEQEMISIIIENLKPVAAEIILVTNNNTYEKFGCRLIEDEVSNGGPSQGIITALQDAQHENIIILSCDMPLINTAIIKQLRRTVSSKIVCFANSFLYPFPGLYSKSILAKWKQSVATGERKMQVLIKQFDYSALPIDNPDLFLNVNTPEDIQRAAQLYTP